MYLVAEFIERRTTGWATRGADATGAPRAWSDCRSTRYLGLMTDPHASGVYFLRWMEPTFLRWILTATVHFRKSF
jgi:hypothetical protein